VICLRQVSGPPPMGIGASSRSGVRTPHRIVHVVHRDASELGGIPAPGRGPELGPIGPVRVIGWSSPGGQEVVLKLPLGHRGAEVLSGDYGVAVVEADPDAGVDELRVKITHRRERLDSIAGAGMAASRADVDRHRTRPRSRGLTRQTLCGGTTNVPRGNGTTATATSPPLQPFRHHM
jgi:hypothetical protein